MPLHPETKYPSRRTYVVKVRSDAKPGSLAGRLENLVTGKCEEFNSAHELIEWLAGDVQAHGEERAAKGKA
jgi:hypothetical protein